MALTNSKRKLIRSLEQKKYRQSTGLFVAEGIKVIEDLLNSDFEVLEVFVSVDLLDRFSFSPDIEVTVLPAEEFKRISLQKTPQPVLALVRQKKWNVNLHALAKRDLVLVLDKVQDPGNMGTILRIADWFGVRGILASEDSVDIYNPKVVQSSMGAVFRVPVVYEDLARFFESVTIGEIFGTFMNGENIYTSELPSNGFIVMGNEANGISQRVEQYISRRLTIPSFNRDYHIESLNVAIATGIVVSEFRRRQVI